jgi:polar amino acid transport system substrate-binding protein
VTRPLRVVIGLAVLSLTQLTACSSAGSDPLASVLSSLAAPTTSPSASATPTPAPSPSDCGNPEQTYNPLPSVPPPSTLPSGSYEAAIKARGRLVAGVSADTLLFGYRDPISGNVQGFDIDQLHAISQAIFGSPDKIEFRVITAAQRIPALIAGAKKDGIEKGGGVDIVARAMTVNCPRWGQVAFSAIYYRAGQRVLVRKDSKATSIKDLDGQKVCGPIGSTSIDNLKAYPKIVPVAVPNHTDCVALFQEGKVDAITGDDAILAGFVAQDPYAKVIGPAFTSEPYGLAVAQGHPEFVQFINAVLEQERTDGAWNASYTKWLAPRLGPGAGQPKPVYGRPVPPK